MREILFKGRRIDNGGWKEGCLVIDESRSNHYKYRIQPKESGNLFAYAINPETICQFTGLIDKNGNKIWENDILKTWDDQYAQVKFGLYNPGSAISGFNQGFYVDFPEESFYRKELGYWCRKVEIAGNVFDNPELLQEETDA